MSVRSRDADRKAKERAAERDVNIPAIDDPSRRAELEADDREWLRYYLPDVFYDEFSSDQNYAVDMVRESLDYGTTRAIAMRRGGGKTAITRGLMLKDMLSGACPFTLYVAASDGKAKQSDQELRYRMTTGCRQTGRTITPVTRLGFDYPFQCGVAAYVSKHAARGQNITTNGGWRIHVQWSGDQLILPSIGAGDVDAVECWERWQIRPGELGAIFLPCGITSSLLQGANVLSVRPRQVILDDLDKRDSIAADAKRSVVDSGKVAAKIEDIIDKTISGMRAPGKRMGQIMLCTVTGKVSVAYRYTDPEIKPAWSGSRLPLLKSPPDDETLWDEYITRRQKGKREKNDDGTAVDPLARDAHGFYLENFDAMNAGAVVVCGNIHDATVLPDGTRAQETPLQWCYDFIADYGQEAFDTEYQQKAPDTEEVDRVPLTAYHIQHNARSGLPQGIVPPDTLGIVCGMDIKKLGFHYCVWAYSDTPTRSVCLEYNFHETKFGGDTLAVNDAERAILNSLHEWKDQRADVPYLTADGEEFEIELALIDSGWKHETWTTQPVEHFCGEAGWRRFLPCKGFDDGKYRRPLESNKVIVGDNCHVAFNRDVPLVSWNADHWKTKVHEGFLTPPGNPGSLALFTPSTTKNRRQQPHLSYAKHITAEIWEERFIPGYRGMVSRWWKDGSQNHYLDASAQGLVARSLLGVNTLDDGPPPPPPTSSNAPDEPPPSYYEPTSYAPSSSRSY